MHAKGKWLFYRVQEIHNLLLICRPLQSPVIARAYRGSNPTRLAAASIYTARASAGASSPRQPQRGIPVRISSSENKLLDR